MGFDVKNTTKISILDVLCPYTCRGCGRMGELFCGCCKNYIKPGGLKICPNCKKAKCACDLPFERSFVVGWREGGLMALVEDYKYQSIRDAAKILAEFLNLAIGDKLSQNVVIVPLPTIGSHIRERGFDHTLRLAKSLAKLRGCRYEQVLCRVNKNVQVGSDEKQRFKQAETAYKVCKKVDKHATYLLLDDVWTTGASMLAAAKKMQEAGATKLDMAVMMIGR